MGQQKCRARTGPGAAGKINADEVGSVRVAAAQHRGEGLHLLLATTLLAGLLVVALGANTLDDVLAIELLLHATDRAIDGLVFTDFDLDGHVRTERFAAKDGH